MIKNCSQTTSLEMGYLEIVRLNERAWPIGHTPCDSIYVKCSEAQTQRDGKWTSGCLGLGKERGESLLIGTRFLEGGWKYSKIRLWYWMHNPVIILKTTEYTLNGWNVWKVNYSLIKPLKTSIPRTLVTTTTVNINSALAVFWALCSALARVSLGSDKPLINPVR